MRALNSLLAVLVTLALFGLAMEGGLRLIGRGPAVTLNRYDPVTGWSKVPGLEAGRRTSEYTVDFAFNSVGLREDPSVTPERLDPEALRVLCLGDSFVLGFGVQRQDHFVDLLEAALRATGRPAEVVNVGTEGWSTDQQVAWLETYGAAWSPDLVLLLPYENDLFWNTQEQYLRFPKPRYGEDGLREPRPLADPGPRPLRDRSALLGLLPGGGAGPPLIEVEGHTLLAEHGVLLEGGGPRQGDITARTRGCLRAVARWSTAEDTPVTVVPLPSHSAIEERYASEVFGPRVLDGLARLDEEAESILEAEASGVAEGGDLVALDELHREVGAAAFGEPAVDDLGDAGVVHDREGLSLLLEAGDHGLGVHAGLDELEGDPLGEGLASLGDPDGTEATLAEGRDQRPGPDGVAAGLLAGTGRRLPVAVGGLIEGAIGIWLVGHRRLRENAPGP